MASFESSEMYLLNEPKIKRNKRELEEMGPCHLHYCFGQGLPELVQSPGLTIANGNKYSLPNNAIDQNTMGARLAVLSRAKALEGSLAEEGTGVQSWQCARRCELSRLNLIKHIKIKPEVHCPTGLRELETNVKQVGGGRDDSRVSSERTTMSATPGDLWVPDGAPPVGATPLE